MKKASYNLKFFAVIVLTLSTITLMSYCPFSDYCNNLIWNHVYHPKRLLVLDSCIAESGVIEAVFIEPDGDYHIRLKPDSGQQIRINTGNQLHQNGCLVLEIICGHKVTQRDAEESCLDYINTVEIPKVGDHITAIGPWVNDEVHRWLEIHPVSSIEKL